MRFDLTMECGNAAFQDDINAALAKTLRHVAGRIEDYGASLSGIVHDRNGNRIGYWKLSEGDAA